MRDFSAVILIGGSGTRLFPLSTKDYPKQFLKVHGEYTLFQNTILRLLLLNPENLYCLVHTDYYSIAKSQLTQLSLTIPVYWILEPCSRNTGPILYYLSTITDTNLLIVPSDHILDPILFQWAFREIRKDWMNDNIVFFGIQPSYPETGYGYIRHCDSNVLEFTEKPNREIAERLIQEGSYWNSGMFYTHSKVLETAFETYAPEIVMSIIQAGAIQHENVWKLGDNYSQCPNISIDYAVMERCQNRKVVPYSGLWTDIGSWLSWWKYVSPDGETYIEGNVDARDCQECLILNRSKERLCLMGLTRMVVVKTDTCCLMMDIKQSQRVKEFV